MKSIYTTTITDEASRRGIKVQVLDEKLPVFLLRKGRRSVRCFNALTDKVGAASFVMAQNKGSANSFLRRHGIPVPAQEPFRDIVRALRFLRKHKRIVVKPAAQWGGRGVSVAVKTAGELKNAIRRARGYEEDIFLEECVSGEDYRLIMVNYRLVAAIKRSPATVVGDGKSSIATLIRRFNMKERKVDPSHQIPLDIETRRALAGTGATYRTVPGKGETIPVRRNSNYHTGGAVEVVTGSLDPVLVTAARKIASLVAIPVIGIDFLFDRSKRKYRVIELSPDLAISPPEGATVARHFIDYLFPSSR